jgi:hypothetical protein
VALILTRVCQCSKSMVSRRGLRSRRGAGGEVEKPQEFPAELERTDPAPPLPSSPLARSRPQTLSTLEAAESDLEEPESAQPQGQGEKQESGRGEEQEAAQRGGGLGQQGSCMPSHFARGSWRASRGDVKCSFDVVSRVASIEPAVNAAQDEAVAEKAGVDGMGAPLFTGKGARSRGVKNEAGGNGQKERSPSPPHFTSEQLKQARLKKGTEEERLQIEKRRREKIQQYQEWFQSNSLQIFNKREEEKLKRQQPVNEQEAPGRREEEYSLEASPMSSPTSPQSPRNEHGMLANLAKGRGVLQAGVGFGDVESITKLGHGILLSWKDKIRLQGPYLRRLLHVWCSQLPTTSSIVSDWSKAKFWFDPSVGFMRLIPSRNVDGTMSHPRMRPADLLVKAPDFRQPYLQPKYPQQREVSLNSTQALSRAPRNRSFKLQPPKEPRGARATDIRFARSRNNGHKQLQGAPEFIPEEGRDGEQAAVGPHATERLESEILTLQKEIEERRREKEMLEQQIRLQKEVLMGSAGRGDGGKGEAEGD